MKNKNKLALAVLLSCMVMPATNEAQAAEIGSQKDQLINDAAINATHDTLEEHAKRIQAAAEAESATENILEVKEEAVVEVVEAKTPLDEVETEASINDATEEDVENTENKEVEVKEEATPESIEVDNGSEVAETESIETTEEKLEEKAEENAQPTETKVEETAETNDETSTAIESNEAVFSNEKNNESKVETELKESALGSSTEEVKSETTDSDKASENSTVEETVKPLNTLAVGKPLEYPEASEGATPPLTTEGAELVAGEDSGEEPKTEGGSDLPETENGAETPAGEANTKKPADTDPKADEATIKAVEGSERYRTTDLSPGSTAVSGGKNDFVDPKDGFKATVVEPNTSTSDKRLYGYEIEIDKKTGQRTYTLISVSSNVLRNNPATLGDKPMMGEGDKLYDGGHEVTYKATGESVLSPGPQVIYGFQANEEDLKHINNNDYTVLGMKDRYNKDNATGLKVLENASIVFKVNPWPDENDELKPIKLEGEYNDKVFVQGQTIKTGIEVRNLDENAKLRLVGKVYNPSTGKIVPGAKAFIDDEGIVYVELPAGAVDASGKINEDSIFYKDPEYKGIQSLDVKFYARPRTKGEFETVAKSAEGGGGYTGTYVETEAGTTTINHKGGAVDISKQGIARYDHYNDIGGFSINLDDTKYHDQAFIDQDNLPTESETASYVRPGVPYKVTNRDEDSITDMTELVNKKNANAKLDLSLIEKKNEGKAEDVQWKVEGTDKALTDIKITAPKNAKAGDFVSFSVRYTYTNGSVDNHKLTFIVKESGNNIPQYYSQVLYPTETETSLPHLSITAEDQEKRRPVEYTIEDRLYTDDQGNPWTASIDSKTGIVTVKPLFAKDFHGGEKLVVPVTAHYVEEENNEITFTEEVRAAFVVKQKLNSLPIYDAKNGKAGESLTSTPTVKGDAGLDTRTPTSYSLEYTEYMDNKGNFWTVSIDEKTGKVTATIPDIREGDKLDGTIISVPVKAHYSEDGQEVGTREATAQFLAYGTNNTIEHKEEIPFEYVVEYDENIPAGQYKVVEDGKEGVKVTRWTIENSKVVGDPEVLEIPATDAIIRVGTKDFTGTVTNTTTEPIPYKVIVRENSNMKLGTHNTVTEGVVGSKEVTYNIPVINGEKDPTKEVTSSEKVTTNAVDQVIEVGTKPIDPKVDNYNYEVQPIIDYVYDNTLDKGKVVEGKVTPGEVKTVIVTTRDPKTGELVTKEEKIVRPARQEIIVGTKDYTGKITYTEREFENYETIIKVDNSKAPGYRNVDQEGKVGVTERDVTRLITNGTAGDPTYSKDRVTPKQDQIITVGALTEGTNGYVSDIPFGYTVVYDESIPAGEYRIEKPGVVGKKRTTWTVRNSEVVGTNEEIITNKEDAIIKVSSKAFKGKVTNTVTQQLPYEIEIVENADLPMGTRYVRQEGEAGSVDITYSQDVKNGAADGAVTTTESNRVEPKKHIIVVGTKPIDTPVKPEITIEKDPNIAAGEVKVGEIVPGKVVTTTEKSIDPLTGKEVVKEVTTTTPATQTIKVGTKAYDGKVEYKEQKVTPFETEIIFDDSLAPGKEVVEQAGINKVEERTITQNYSNGTLTDKLEGEFTTATEGQKQVIRVGTMTNGVHRHEEKLPFGVKVEYNENIPAGQYEVVVEGKEGVRVTRWTIENSKVVGEPEVLEVPATDAIIRVGTKAFEGTVSHEVTEAIPFEVEIRENSSLPVGTTRVITEGKEGSKTTEYSFEVVNGAQKPNTTVNATEKSKTDAVNEVIEIGTKPVEVTGTTEKPIVEIVPVETEKIGFYEVGDIIPGKVETKYEEKIDPNTGIRTITETQVVTPPKQIVRVGTQDYTGEVKYTDRVYENYKTTIIQDPTLAADEQVVEKQGVVGIKEREITRSITNGTASDPSYGEYKTIAEKQDQVIRVGTKTDGTHTVIEELPFSYTINEVDTLKKGEYEVVTEGKNGSRTTEYRIENSKVVEGSANVKEETKPTNAVINVGKGTLNGTHAITETEVVPYETEIVFDDTLKAGEEVVENQGSNGSKSRKVTLTIEDGKVVATDEGAYTEDSAPVNRKVRVGTQTTGTITHEEKIPFSYEITYDPTVAAGTYVEDVKGVEGTRTTTWTITNSTPVKTGEVTEGPTNAKIRVGTKDYTGTVTNTTTEPIPFKVIVRENPNMKLGTSKTVTDGVVGSKDVTYNIPVKNGEKDTTKEVTSSEKVTTEAVDQVIEVGTKPVEAVEKDVSAEVGVEVEIVNDPELDLGKTKTGKLVPGKVENTVTTKYNPQTGKLETTEDKKVTPAKQIIYVGTKDLVGTQEFVVTQPVPFETEYIQDPNLEAGKTEIKQQGQNGQKTVTYKAEAKNGEVTSHKATEEITKEPVKQIIRVGTKSQESKTEVVKESIPFETEYKYDDTLAAGTYEVDEEGKLGEKTSTTTTTIINGESTSNTSEETTKEPVNRVVRIGTKIDRETKDVVSTETYEIPFETKVTYDPNIKAGEEIVKVAGENGSRTVTVTVPVVEGKAGEPVVKDDVTKAPTTREVVIGTMDTSTDSVYNIGTITEYIPFETRYVEDDTLELGKTEVEIEGQPGTKVTTTSTTIINGEVKTTSDVKTTKQPVEKVVRIGTKVADTTLPDQNLNETKTEVVPFTTIIKENNKMPVGSTNVVQEGENGENTITVNVNVENGVAKDPVITTTQTKAPTTRIIEIGTGEVVNNITKDIPFETEVIFDDSLPVGEKRVEGGVVGKKVTTVTHKYVDGKVIADTSEKDTVEPKKQIVRVGTKTNPVDTKDVNKTIEVDVPYTTEIIYDDTMNAGEKKVTQNGQNGKRTITVKVPVKDGVANDPQVTQNEITTKPVNEVIRVGTKCNAPEVNTNDVVSSTEIEVPYEVTIIEDSNLDAGTKIVDKEGKAGKRVVTVTIKPNGETNVNDVTTIKPENRVIRIGTKPTETNTNTEVKVYPEVEVDIPYDTKYIFDDTIPAGDSVTEPGKNGKAKYTTKVVDDKEVTTKEILEQPKTKIVRIGTKGTKFVGEEIVEKGAPFETETIYDPTLNDGFVKVIQEGQDGKTVSVIEYKYDENKGVLVPTGSEIIKNVKPVKQIIIVGTKPKEIVPPTPNPPVNPPVDNENGGGRVIPLHPVVEPEYRQSHNPAIEVTSTVTNPERYYPRIMEAIALTNSIYFDNQIGTEAIKYDKDLVEVGPESEVNKADEEKIENNLEEKIENSVEETSNESDRPERSIAPWKQKNSEVGSELIPKTGDETNAKAYAAAMAASVAGMGVVLAKKKETEEEN